jgi:hypothetical protein
VKYQDVLSFIQSTEDDNSIARNKNDFVAYITKNVIDKLTLKQLVVSPFPLNTWYMGWKTSIIDLFQGQATRAPPHLFMGSTSKV